MMVGREMWRAALCTVIVLAVSSCAPKFNTVPPDLRAQMLRDLSEGKPNLDCGIDCYWSFSHNSDTLSMLHNAGQWQELAVRTMQIGHQNDAAYYYLGRAAEGLGYLRAAETYYQYSAALYSDSSSQHHCREMARCYVDVATVVPVHLNAVRERLSRPVVIQLVSPDRPQNTSSAHTKKSHAIAITQSLALSAKLKDEEGTAREFVNGEYTNGLPTSDPNSFFGGVERVVIGDLNHDGVADAAVLCWYGNGTAARKYYINIITGISGRVVSTAPMYLGSKLTVESFALRSGRVQLRAKVSSSPTRTKDVVGSFVLKKGKVVFQ